MRRRVVLPFLLALCAWGQQKALPPSNLDPPPAKPQTSTPVPPPKEIEEPPFWRKIDLFERKTLVILGVLIGSVLIAVRIFRNMPYRRRDD